MALVLSGSIDISGSMTATTILVSSPGAAGMVSSSAQIRELAPLMAYTASLKGASIVSSSQQIQNYFTFAVTSSANTFYNSIGTTALNMNNMASLGSIGGGAIYLPYNSGLFFRTLNGATSRGKIQADDSNNLLLNSDNGGFVGIGTTLPTTKLEVVGTTHVISTAGNITGINLIPGSQTNIYQTIGDGTGGARYHASIETNFANYENAGSSQMVFKTETKSSGTTDTSATQMVIRPTGDIRITTLVGTGTRTVVADANGQLSAPVSDESVKENIRPIEYGINEIMQMNPVWFEFKDEFKNYGETRQNGNIAQEMVEIIPEAVFTTPRTGMMGINYEQLHAVYIKAIQEQQAIIDGLIARIEALENN